jgi:D-glycero-D-manno-heptose 1,7-bisphosphate phosphatase
MKQAVFLDRDGVINPNVFNPKNGQWESPHHAEDFSLFPWTLDSLKILKSQFLLFLVSNQPSYAKGKTSLENIQAIHKNFLSILKDNNLEFTDYFYCYHHPNGIVDEYSGPCKCRKPSPYFLQSAEKKYNLKMESSWMIGDRITDIQCGSSAGTRTIYVQESGSPKNNDEPYSDFTAKNLAKATDIILKQS